MRAVDVDCPKCGNPAGTYCNGFGVGVDLCRERITAAAAKTRATRSTKPVDGGRRERDGRSKAWTTGYAAALASVFRFGAVSGSVIRKTMIADGITLRVLKRDGVESYDMKRIREAWGHDHDLSKPRLPKADK